MTAGASCGAAGAGAGVPPSAKPTPTLITLEPSSAPWVMPFEDVSFVSPGEGWAVNLSQADRAVEVIHSLDGGVTWTPPVKVAPMNVASGDAPPHFGIRFANRQMGWVFGSGIYATNDGGLTWSKTGAVGEVFDLATIGDSSWAITGCDPRISLCARELMIWDSGTGNWRAAVPQPPVTSGPFRIIRATAQRALISQETEMDTRLVRTEDGGVTWRRLSIPCRGFAGMPVATLDGVHLWMVCAGGMGAGQQLKDVYTSSDSGDSWVLRARAGLHGNVGAISSSGYAHLLALGSASTGFLAMDRGDFYRSTDRGVTWINSGISHGEAFFSALWFADPAHGWVAAQVGTIQMEGRIGLYRTIDGGAHWALVSSMLGSM
jgi:photosystem II stability/assembly factor-like uncharacterized protein